LFYVLIKTKTAALFLERGRLQTLGLLLRRSSTRETAPASKAEVVIKARKLKATVHCFIFLKRRGL
jgi:hypothetical protein